MDLPWLGVQNGDMKKCLIEMTIQKQAWPLALKSKLMIHRVDWGREGQEKRKDAQRD
jgi:hypothetical protein